MRRRTVLAVVGGIAVSVPTAALAKEDVTEDDHDCDTAEMPTGKSGDEVITTEEVPAEWKEQVEHAREVNRELTEELQDKSWWVTKGVTSGDNTICGRNEGAIRLRVTDKEAAEAYLGDERDGVQIILTEVDDDFEMQNLPDELNDNPNSSDRDGTHGDESETDTESTTDDADELIGFGALGTLASLGGIGYMIDRKRNGSN